MTAVAEAGTGRWQVSDPAAALLRRALVWDNTMPFSDGSGGFAAHFRTLQRMPASGYDCVSVTIASDNDDMAGAVRRITRLRAHIRDNADRLVLAERADDVLRAQAAGKLAVVMHFQGTLPFDRDAGLVETFYKLGVRHALMAYNQKNHVGDGCHERTDAGLSRFGIEVIQAMNRTGMVVDVSHTGYRTSMETMEVSTAPVIFSHSNPRALVDHERNITDDQARACAATGGVIGLNGVGIFLGGNDISADTLFRHVDYWVQLVGIDHVGLGLDHVSDPAAMLAFVQAHAAKYPDRQYGQAELLFAAPEDLPPLVEAMLQHGYAEDGVAKVLGGNWLRIARQVWQ
ncbi:MAG: dipeptidase [Sneathiellaceae bacterium]